MYMTVKRRKNKNDLILIFFILKVSYARYGPVLILWPVVAAILDFRSA
jgi:hypothetical protein